MISIKATPPPKLAYPKMAMVPFAYALALAALAGTQLLGIGGFDVSEISYDTPGQPFWVITLAATEIFALPFLLRLNLSPLARIGSAALSLIAPFAYMMYLFSLQNHVTNSFGVIQLLLSTSLILAGVASFAILDGSVALQKSKNWRS